MTEREVVYRREELYAEVWAEPVESVAKQYSISDVVSAEKRRSTL